MALGAALRLEADGADPETVRRFKLAVRGPLGGLGDALVWAAWLPGVSVLALTLFWLGLPGVWAAGVFLAVYNVGHVGLRLWGFRVGLSEGRAVGRRLDAANLVGWTARLKGARRALGGPAGRDGPEPAQAVCGRRARCGQCWGRWPSWRVYSRDIMLGGPPPRRSSRRSPSLQPLESFGGYEMSRQAALEKEVEIVNRAGMHARPAAEFVKLAGTFNAEILVEKDGLQVNGKSIMGVLMLAAEHGSRLRLRAHGSRRGGRSGRPVRSRDSWLRGAGGLSRLLAH